MKRLILGLLLSGSAYADVAMPIMSGYRVTDTRIEIDYYDSGDDIIEFRFDNMGQDFATRPDLPREVEGTVALDLTPDQTMYMISVRAYNPQTKEESRTYGPFYIFVSPPTPPEQPPAEAKK